MVFLLLLYKYKKRINKLISIDKCDVGCIDRLRMFKKEPLEMFHNQIYIYICFWQKNRKKIMNSYLTTLPSHHGHIVPHSHVI